MFSYDPVFTAADVGKIDALAISRLGDDGAILMQRAADHALRCLRQMAPPGATFVREIAVLAGPGNNGGDALLLAAGAQRQGYRVTLYGLEGTPAAWTGAAAKAWAAAQAAGLSLRPELPAQAPGLVVDGLFGTGLARPLRGLAAEWVQWIERARQRGAGVLALDIPSGLNADTGQADGVHVVADLTATFVARKVGLDLGQAIDACGRVCFDALGVRAAEVASRTPVAQRLRSLSLPARARNAHKGVAGHVVIVGGRPALAGASVLAAHAALRGGAGKVSLLADPSAQYPSLWPEVMRVETRSKNDLIGLAGAASALCVGPGLGRDDDVLPRLQVIRRAPRPQVWDADALFALSRWPDLRPQTVILTPHPGEAATLLGWTTAEVQRDRVAALTALVERWRCPVVLKGARTLVAWPGTLPIIIPQGYPGLATGGMGDVLAGLIAALCAQGLTPEQAAVVGPYLLAHTADQLRPACGDSLLPQDILNHLRMGPA